MREQGRTRTGVASLPHVKLSPVSAPGPAGEWQEHLDAVVSFAGGCQRRRLFRELTFTIIWATGDLPEECRFLLNTQSMFLKKKKDGTSKQLDDDEWIRSLTDAQEVTTDAPEDSVTHQQQEVDLQKVRPIQMEEFLRKCVSRRLLVLSEGEIAALTSSLRQIGVELLWMTGSFIGPLARIKVDEAGSAQAHGSSSTDVDRTPTRTTFL